MQKHILVIDDDEAILEVMKIILQEKGYIVTTISDTSHVEKYMKTEHPDIIFVDFWMAGLNGEKLVSLLKSDRTSHNIPIIMISANHEVKKIARDVHANDFLAKPFTIEDLTAIVKKYTN